MKLIQFLLLSLLILLVGCGGGGGGGGGGTTKVSLSGRIVSITTGGAPSPVATVRAGSDSGTTSATDGTFQFDVSSGTSSVTVTFTPSGGAPIVRTFTFSAVITATDIGDLYVGPEEVTLHGKVVDSSTGAALSGAKLTIAGRTATTDGTGEFNITNVAYDSSTLAVFLGLQGTASRTGYFSQFFSPPGSALGGVVEVGTIALIAEGGITPPPAPFNISGTVSPSGGGSTVELLSGATVIRTVTADGTGKYQFWAPVGTYTVRATKAALTGSSPAVLTNVNTPITVNVTLN